jgi:CBS domain-containing protein
MERDARILLVRDFMTPNVRTLPADMAIDDALVRLRRYGHSGAPVVDADGQVVGVLSEVDCMRVLASAAFHAMPAGDVSIFMSRDVESLSPDDDIFAATQRFEQSRVRRFPVIDGRMLVGIVTVRDLDRALWEITQERKKVHKEPEHPPGAAWDPRR